MMGMALAMGVAYVVFYIFYAIGGYRMFQKFGEPGWKAFIPFYNTYVQYCKVWNPTMGIVYVVLNLISSFGSTDAEGFVALLLLIAGIASIVISIMGNMKLAKSFGHGTGFALGLTFLQPIFILILGFGSDEYLGASDEA